MVSYIVLLLLSIVLSIIYISNSYGMTQSSFNSKKFISDVAMHDACVYWTVEILIVYSSYYAPRLIIQYISSHVFDTST